MKLATATVLLAVSNLAMKVDVTPGPTEEPTEEPLPTVVELWETLELVAGEVVEERECLAGQGDWTQLTELPSSMAGWKYKGVKCRSTVSFFDEHGNCPDTMDAVKTAALNSAVCAQPPTIYALPGRGCKCVPAPAAMPEWVPEGREYVKARCEPVRTTYDVNVLYYGCPASTEDEFAHMESNYAVASMTSTNQQQYLTQDQRNIIQNDQFNLANVPGANIDNDGYIWSAPRAACVKELSNDQYACYDSWVGDAFAASFWRADQPIGGNSNAVLVAVASVSCVCLALTCAALFWVQHRAKKYARMEDEVARQPSNYVI